MGLSGGAFWIMPQPGPRLEHPDRLSRSKRLVPYRVVVFITKKVPVFGFEPQRHLVVLNKKHPASNKINIFSTFNLVSLKILSLEQFSCLIAANKSQTATVTSAYENQSNKLSINLHKSEGIWVKTDSGEGHPKGGLS